MVSAESSPQTLPKFISISKCQAAGRSWAGRVALAALPDLERYLTSKQNGYAQLSITTDLHPRYGFPVLHLDFAAALDCLCYRCLQVYQHEVSAQTSYVVLASADYQSLLEQDFEILRSDELERPVINFHDLLEQELIVRAPWVSDHNCADKKFN